MTYHYKPHGVCSREIIIETNGDIIQNMQFIGGCEGNLKGICALCKGKKMSEIAQTLEGINCGGKGTSCPDQLSKALKQIMA